MKLNDIPKEELESMNYDDIAYIILKEEKKPLRINEIFGRVCNALNLSESVYEEKIADFFGLLTTDKRFLMLEDGSWDLKELHNPQVVIDDDDEDDEAIITVNNDEAQDEIVEEQEDNEENIFYDTDNDDDMQDDDLEDFMVINVDEEETNS